MEREHIRRLLDEVRTGRTSVDDAVDRLRRGHLEALEFATLDLHRALRRGAPEAVYGEGKTPEQIERIVERIHDAGQTVMVTRVGPDVARRVRARYPSARFHDVARAIVLLPAGVRRRKRRPGVVVVCAGTSDLPVAEEAAVTAETMGNEVERIRDVGVAGLHRMLSHRESLLTANVIVVVAGMEGALPSVIAGLVDCPVIGVPTSTGYGTGEGGRAALLAMLNSCASGLTVVNIDNGFGAGYAAGTINRSTRTKPRRPPDRK